MLRWLGHRSVAVLDGGVQPGARRRRADRGDAARRPAPPPYPAARSRRLSTPPASRPGRRARRVLDARGGERFRGEVEPIDAVAGHIPGALNRFHKDNLDADGRFKSPAELRAEFAALLGDRRPTR